MAALLIDLKNLKYYQRLVFLSYLKFWQKKKIKAPKKPWASNDLFLSFWNTFVLFINQYIFHWFEEAKKHK